MSDTQIPKTEQTEAKIEDTTGANDSENVSTEANLSEKDKSTEPTNASNEKDKSTEPTTASNEKEEEKVYQETIVMIDGKERKLTEDELKALDEGKMKMSINGELINKEAKETIALEIQQEDESNPLFSSNKTWGTLKKESGMNGKIYLGVSKLTWKYPSSIQNKSIPFLLNPDNQHVNLIAQSQSGTGKTGCFVVAALQSVDPTLKSTQVIILSPTLEIAYQIDSVLTKVGCFLECTSRLIRKQGEYKKLNDQILVATPGSLLTLIKKKRVSTQHVKLLILDEADEFLNNVGTRKTDQVKTIKSKLPKDIRILLFSATYMDVDSQTAEERQNAAKVREFVDSFIPEPVHKILVKKEDLSLQNMTQLAIHCPGRHGKDQALLNILDSVSFEKMVVFVNTTNKAESLCRLISDHGFSAEPLAGRIDAQERIDTTQKFMTGENKILVATNVFARGVDVRSVTHVINYDMPITYNTTYVDPAVYIHRVGRTARFGTNGTAINLINGDVDIQAIKHLEDYYDIKIKYVSIDFDENLEDDE